MYGACDTIQHLKVCIFTWATGRVCQTEGLLYDNRDKKLSSMTQNGVYLCGFTVTGISSKYVISKRKLRWPRGVKTQQQRFRNHKKHFGKQHFGKCSDILENTTLWKKTQKWLSQFRKQNKVYENKTFNCCCCYCVSWNVAFSKMLLGHRRKMTF